MVIHSKKRGQVTIFIILAILLIIIALAIFWFIPKLKTSSELDVKNPNTYFQSCMESQLEDTLTTIGLQGGSMEPESAYEYYQGNRVQYLCRTLDYYKACDMDAGLNLKKDVQYEIEKELKDDALICYDDLISIYRAKGYTVIPSQAEAFSVSLLPGKVKLSLIKDLTLTKTDTQKYSSFSVISNNNLYELIGIASDMAVSEAREGKVTNFPDYALLFGDYIEYPEWAPQDDGTHIYILTDKDSGNKFQFATRSWVNPPI